MITSIVIIAPASGKTKEINKITGDFMRKKNQIQTGLSDLLYTSGYLGKNKR